MRLLLVLSSPLYGRNYLESDALSALDGIDVRVVAHASLAGQARVTGHPGFVGTFDLDPALVARHNHIFTLNTWRHRRRSKTFRYRFTRLYGAFSQPGASWLGRVRRVLTGALYQVGGSPPLFPLVTGALQALTPPNAQLRAYLEDLRPDVVVVPTGLMDSVAMDVVRLCRDGPSRTLLLVDNWDGMSSKTVMWARPDFVGAWGEQSRQHAVAIHGMAPERTFAIGTPRFSDYFREPDPTLPPLYDFPFLLFTGSAIPFDELSALQALEREFDAHPEIYGALKILYRPHPWRQKRSCPDRFRREDFRHVVMDRQMAANYEDPQGVKFQPDLEYYQRLLYEARLVIGPPTSMIVEALLCGTRVLTLAYDDGVHYESPNKSLANYMNLDGVERMAGHVLVRQKEETTALARGMVADPHPPGRGEMRASLEYFFCQTPGTYPERLRQAAERIVAGEFFPHPPASGA